MELLSFGSSRSDFGISFSSVSLKSVADRFAAATFAKLLLVGGSGFLLSLKRQSQALRPGRSGANLALAPLGRVVSLALCLQRSGTSLAFDDDPFSSGGKIIRLSGQQRGNDHQADLTGPEADNASTGKHAEAQSRNEHGMGRKPAARVQNIRVCGCSEDCNACQAC
jgi:hypothetical protein